MTMFPAITNLAIHSRYANDNAVYRIDWNRGRLLYEQSEMATKYPVWQSEKWDLALGEKLADDADLYLDEWLDANGFQFVEENQAALCRRLRAGSPYEFAIWEVRVYAPRAGHGSVAA